MGERLIDPVLEKLVRDIRHIEAAMGSPDKRVADSEIPVRVRLGKSVVAAQHIPAGAVVNASVSGGRTGVSLAAHARTALELSNNSSFSGRVAGVLSQ